MNILSSSPIACDSVEQSRRLGLLRKTTVNLHHFTRLALALICFTMGMAYCCSSASAQAPDISSQTHDGQHDFDFHFGNWRTHIKLRINPLTNSKHWVESEGTVSVRKILDGLGNLEEIEASNATTQFKGITLFLYDPKAHQWSQASASMNAGILSTPLIGEFKGGRGEFYGQETYDGRTVLVRFVWSDITTISHRVEQSYSADGGKTWETNLIANLTRENE